jgi:chromosome segregation ATPase
MLLAPVTRICACNPDPPPDCSDEETALATAEAVLEGAIFMLEMARQVLQMRTTQVNKIKDDIKELEAELAEINRDIQGLAQEAADLDGEITKLTGEVKHIALELGKSIIAHAVLELELSIAVATGNAPAAILAGIAIIASEAKMAYEKAKLAVKTVLLLKANHDLREVESEIEEKKEDFDNKALELKVKEGALIFAEWQLGEAKSDFATKFEDVEDAKEVVSDALAALAKCQRGE